MTRTALASLIAGRPLDAAAWADGRLDGLLAEAESEGVSALAAQALLARGGLDPARRARLAEGLRARAAQSLLREAAARAVLAALPPGELRVLKGQALAQWLYPQPHLREVSDLDLLFPDRAAAEAAATALAPLGYRAPYRPNRFAHGMACRRTDAGLARLDLDLHWRLSRAPLFDRLPGFAGLAADPVPLPALGPRASGLSPVEALLHAALHRAANLAAGLGDRLKWLFDIHLLAGRLDADAWTRAQDLAAQRGLAGVLGHALDASAADFDTRVPEPTREALRAAAAGEAFDPARLQDWRYVQARNLAALRGTGDRLRWVWQQAFPPVGYLRDVHGDVGRWALWGRRVLRLGARLFGGDGVGGAGSGTR